MKKKILLIESFLIVSIILFACGDNDEVENPPQNATDEGQQQEIDSNTNTEYVFTEFDLDADYEDTNDAIDVDYENENNDKMEASYRDKSQEIDLTGDAALQELDSIFSSFNFDESTSEEEILNTITDAFNIPKDAQNIELDIQFSSGTEKEYRR